MAADPHRALIWTMVLVSAADGEMTDAELKTIGENVQHLQAFRSFDLTRLPEVARECTDWLADADELDAVVARVTAALPERLKETAYALACDVAMADDRIPREAMRMLEVIRQGLDLDRLIAAAIQRGSRARHTPIRRDARPE